MSFVVRASLPEHPRRWWSLGMSCEDNKLLAINLARWFACLGRVARSGEDPSQPTGGFEHIGVLESMLERPIGLNHYKPVVEPATDTDWRLVALYRLPQYSFAPFNDAAWASEPPPAILAYPVETDRIYLNPELSVEERNRIFSVASIASNGTILYTPSNVRAGSAASGSATKIVLPDRPLLLARRRPVDRGII